MNIKIQIQNAIASNRIEEAIRLLSTVMPTEASAISQKYKELESDRIVGVLRLDDQTIGMSRITKAIMDSLNKIGGDNVAGNKIVIGNIKGDFVGDKIININSGSGDQFNIGSITGRPGQTIQIGGSNQTNQRSTPQKVKYIEFTYKSITREYPKNEEVSKLYQSYLNDVHEYNTDKIQNREVFFDKDGKRYVSMIEKHYLLFKDLDDRVDDEEANKHVSIIEEAAKKVSGWIDQESVSPKEIRKMLRSIEGKVRLATYLKKESDADWKDKSWRDNQLNDLLVILKNFGNS